MKDGGLEVKDDGLRVKDDGLRVKDGGLRVKDDGLRVKDDGLEVKNDGLRLAYSHSVLNCPVLTEYAGLERHAVETRSDDCAFDRSKFRFHEKLNDLTSFQNVIPDCRQLNLFQTAQCAAGPALHWGWL